MFEKLSSPVFISILKNSLVHLNDLDEDQLSQSVSFTTQLENIRSNIFNESFTPKKNYYNKALWFDMSNCLTILSIMYPTLSFYCYSELNNDVHIYKFKETENKTIIERTNIYAPINVNNCVCILHENNQISSNHFKALILKIPKNTKIKQNLLSTVR
tara:strand:- start:264 stop:737 length:474 start_codon:yes stop_codon:yes gene_type:complete